MKYVAEDGTIFNTEQECLEYEKDQKKALYSFIWYDDKLKVTDDYNHVEYMDILDNVELVVDYINENYGFVDGIDGPGFYRFHYNGYWEFIEDLIKNYEDQLSQLKAVVCRLKAFRRFEELDEDKISLHSAWDEQDCDD